MFCKVICGWTRSQGTREARAWAFIQSVRFPKWAYCDCLYWTINIIPLCFLFYRPLYQFSFYLWQTRSSGTTSYLMLCIGGGSLLLPPNMSTGHTQTVGRVGLDDGPIKMLSQHQTAHQNLLQRRGPRVVQPVIHISSCDCIVGYHGWHMIDCFDGHWDEDKFAALCL